MKFLWLKFIFILVTGLTLTHCANIIEPLTDKDSDKIYLYEARKQIDDRKFNEAISTLQKLSSAAKERTDTKLAFASAYAGACGMEFIPFFNSIANANLGASSLFIFFRSSFTDKVAYADKCTEAESFLKQIGATEALRLAAMNGQKDVNMLMALTSMAKVGAILRTKSDNDGTNSLGDGTTDVGFDACDANQISDDEVINVATGFALLIENLPSLLGASNSTATVLDTVSQAVDLLCDPTNTSDIKCVVLDKGDIPVADKPTFVKTYRELIGSQGFGIGSCDLSTNPTGCCP